MPQIKLTTSEAATPQLVFEWTDSYTLSATHLLFKNGGEQINHRIVAYTYCLVIVKVTGMSVPRQMDFKQEYLCPDWAHSSVAPDATAPDNGFHFKNGMICSAVVSLEYPPNSGNLTPSLCFNYNYFMATNENF